MRHVAVGNPEPHEPEPHRQRRSAAPRYRSGTVVGGHQVLWAPQEGPQLALVTCPLYDALIGGARGVGKTDACLGDWFLHAMNYGRAARGLFVRREYPQLEDVIRRAQELFTPLGAIFRRNRTNCTLPNGAALKFRPVRDREDASKFLGHAYTRIYVEELTTWPDPEPVDLIKATLRSVEGVPVGFRASTNPGGVGHCVPCGDVLTPDGWRDIREFRAGDPVYTVAPDGSLVSARVAQLHCRRYVGDLVRVSARGLEMICTPNHKVAKVGGCRGALAGSRFSLVPFERLPGQVTILRTVSWRGESVGRFTVPEYRTRNRRRIQPTSLFGIDYCALLGWFLAEGCVVDRDKAFAIAQIKSASREKLRQLLEDRCGFHVSWQSQGAIVYAPDWWAYLRQFGRCRDKFVPPEVKSASVRELEALLDALMEGDGCRRRVGGIYDTISRQLADDVAEVALKLGYVVYQSERRRKDREGATYQVNINRVKSGGTEILTGQHVYRASTRTRRRSDVTHVPFDGNVYCLGIEGMHSFVIRQHGSVWVSGNSWAKARYVDPAPGGLEPIWDELAKQWRVYIPGTLDDNVILLEKDPGYEARILEAAGSPELARAWRWGVWDIALGAFFADVWNPRRQVLDPFPVPAGWRRLRAFDWGSAKPACLLALAVADGEAVEIAGRKRFLPRGSVVVYDEIYTVEKDGRGSPIPNRGKKLSNAELGGLIARRSIGTAWRGCVADPSIFTEEGGPSIYAQLREGALRLRHDLRFEPADNSRVAGWQRLRQLLAESNKERPESPGLYITRSCSNLLRTLPAVARDDKKPEDVDTDAEDHAPDALRYGVMALLDRRARSVKLVY